MKSKDAPIYRENDIVKVVNPEEFIRCGYPLCVKDVAAGFTKEQTDLLVDALSAFGITRNRELTVQEQFNDITDRIAYHAMKEQEFGVSLRTIHTKRNETLDGILCYVIRKKVVKTGEYEPERGSYDYEYGHHEYEPAQLFPTGTHVILYLRPMNWELEIDYFWIEESNVVKTKAVEKKNPHDYYEKTQYVEA